MTLILESIQRQKALTSNQAYHHDLGYSELEVVCRATLAAFDLSADDARFKQTDLLRMWMYYFPINLRIDETNDTTLLKLHFYTMVLAAVPLFPCQMGHLMIQICAKVIRKSWWNGIGTELSISLYSCHFLQSIIQTSDEIDFH